MMRVVLDTNVFIASIGKMSPLRPVFDAFRAGQLQLVLSTEIFFEYIEKLEEKTNAAVALNIGRALEESDHVDVVNISYRWQAITADEDDNKFFDCAVSGNADYLVTNDHHFKKNRDNNFPPVVIINSEQLLKLLSKP